MTRLRRQLRTAAVVASCLGLAGCSLALKLPTTPTATTPGTGATASTGAAGAPTRNEVPTPPGPDERAAGGAATPAAAVRAFAARYINWTAADIRARLQRLAADSVGQARSAMALAARQTGADPELAAAGVANHGRVEAVAALAGGHGRYVVVTRESTTATNSSAYQGLAPAWHLAVATVVHRRGGWVLSGWQPKN